LGTASVAVLSHGLILWGALTFRDFDNVDKIAPLHRELSLDGAPEGDDPAIGDIG
jgi:hypothetical protein